MRLLRRFSCFFFFFNDTATTEIYTLSLHDALPIFKNTVGKAIEGKTPRQIEKIRILDPACGSGSFLIGAFQCLIDYHIRWFLDHPEVERTGKSSKLEFMREVHEDPDGSHRLSIYRKV